MTVLDRILEQAATARADHVRTAADRPSQRRCLEEQGSPAAARVHADRLQLRAAEDDSGLLHFSGHASVYERGYEMWDMFGPYTETVVPGAGAESLTRADLDVPFVLAHDSLRRIARTTNGTLTVTEDEVGLAVDAPALDPSDVDVAYIAPKLRSGLIDEMSFKFTIVRGSWSPDWLEYHIESYDIHRGDVAIVGYGANPYTAGSGLRSQMPPLTELTEDRLRQLERDLRGEYVRRGLTKPSGMKLADVGDILARTSPTGL